jgi:signal peptidase I
VFGEGSPIPIFITGKPKEGSSQILVTISNSDGEKTVYISKDQMMESKAKYFVQTPPERIVSGLDKWLRMAFSTFKLSGYVGAIALLTLSLFTFTGVVKARVVLTGSMEPVISIGDIILTTPPSRLEPKQGDVVAYVAKRFDGSPVGVFSHRIIGGNIREGFIVKGDANPAPDVQRPKLDDIEGVVFYTIPFLGRLLAPRTLLILIPLIIGFWLIMDALKNNED